MICSSLEYAFCSSLNKMNQELLQFISPEILKKDFIFSTSLRCQEGRSFCFFHKVNIICDGLLTYPRCTLSLAHYQLEMDTRLLVFMKGLSIDNTYSANKDQQRSIYIVIIC